MNILETPNPNAIKIDLNSPVLKEGKFSIKSMHDCENIPLGKALYELQGIDQIHFFQHTITLSKFSFESWDNLIPEIQTIITKYLPTHNSDFLQIIHSRDHLSEDLLKIETILDEKIRPFLQADGGDLICLSYTNHILLVKYEGACGTCPSSTMGTLEAIKQILKESFDPLIDVFIAP